jgi:hypothetical protein
MNTNPEGAAASYVASPRRLWLLRRLALFSTDVVIAESASKAPGDTSTIVELSFADGEQRAVFIKGMFQLEQSELVKRTQNLTNPAGLAESKSQR